MLLTRVSIEEKKAVQFFFSVALEKNVCNNEMRNPYQIRKIICENVKVLMRLLSKNDFKGSFVCLCSFERKKFCKLLNRLF